MAGEDLDKYMADEPEQQNAEPSSSSAEVKPEVKQDTSIPYVDEKGVPYFNRFKELSEKFKDVDIDRWGKVKDFDPERVKKALELEEFMTQDSEKFRKALAVYEEQQAEEESQNKKEETPKFLTREELDKLLQERDYSKAQNDWMQKWTQGVEKSMNESIKSESYKDFGDLHDLDKEIIVKKVGEIYEKDANSKFPKLSLKDISNVTDQVVKSLYEYRMAVRGQAVKKDSSPQSITGNKGDAMKKAETEYDENEDTKDMISLYKELSNPHI